MNLGLEEPQEKEPPATLEKELQEQDPTQEGKTDEKMNDKDDSDFDGGNKQGDKSDEDDSEEEYDPLATDDESEEVAVPKVAEIKKFQFCNKKINLAEKAYWNGIWAIKGKPDFQKIDIFEAEDGTRFRVLYPENEYLVHFLSHYASIVANTRAEYTAMREIKAPLKILVDYEMKRLATKHHPHLDDEKIINRVGDFYDALFQDVAVGVC